MMTETIPNGPWKLAASVAKDWAIMEAQMRLIVDNDADRMRAVLSIATDVDALYRDAVSIRQWLKGIDPVLGDTPLVLMLDGQTGLFLVQQRVQYLSGR